MYVNHIFSLRLKRYGSQKKAARMAAEGVQKMSKYVKPVIYIIIPLTFPILQAFPPVH